jgi:hypothetical protein
MSDGSKGPVEVFSAEGAELLSEGIASDRTLTKPQPPSSLSDNG